MRTERERGIQRNSAFLKAQYIYFTIRDGYISNPTDYTVTWEATVNGKKRTFVSYKCSTEGSALRHYHHTLNSFLKNSYVSSDASFAYKENSNILSCLNRHLHSDVFLKTDIHSFFTSIEKDRMKEKLERTVKRRYKRLCGAIVGCCYYEDKLPLGFITSPVLSDIYLTELDACFEKRKDIVYTRYADDFIISSSGENAECVLQDVLEEIRDRLGKLGLELNKKKTYIRRLRQSGDAIHLLGLNLVKTDSDTNRITVSDSYIRKTSIEFCNLLSDRHSLSKEELEQALVSVYGRIQFIKNASEGSARKLRKMLSIKLKREVFLDHASLQQMLID